MTELVFSRAQANRRRKANRVSWRRAFLSALDRWIGWSGILATIGVMLLALLYIMTLAYVRGEVVQLGREISALNEQVRSAEEQVKEARLKWKAQQSPARLERLAKKMNLAAPRPDQIRVVDANP